MSKSILPIYNAASDFRVYILLYPEHLDNLIKKKEKT